MVCNYGAVELIIKPIEQISNLVRGCRKEELMWVRASVDELVGVRKQGQSLKKVVSSHVTIVTLTVFVVLF